jgi:1-aminocyclopropane-1-carboxylate deaminase
VITFGGAFSNHIHATAAYCHMMHLKCVGIIRGEDDASNPTLRRARALGMQLYFISRAEYKLKEASDLVKFIIAKHEGYGIIPEGGDHPLALRGVAEMLDEIEDQKVIPDYIALSCGTGATAAGVLKSVIDRSWQTKVIVIPALNNHHLQGDILSKANAQSHAEKLIYIDDFSRAGYAKTDPALIQYMHQVYDSTHIPLDPVYTGKLAFALTQMGKQDFFKPLDKLIIVHTGGLQGISGYNYLMQKKNQGVHMVIRY